MIIWLIGFLFCVGLMTGHKDDKEDTWKSVGYMVLLGVLWPLLLGAYVYFTLENIEKDSK